MLAQANAKKVASTCSSVSASQMRKELTKKMSEHDLKDMQQANEAFIAKAESHSSQISLTSGQSSCPVVETYTAEPTLPYLIDKVTDIAVANKEAGLVIASAIGTSVILYVIADAAAKLIRAVRSGNQA